MRAALVFAFATLLTACGGSGPSDDPVVDSGAHDAGPVDGGADLGALDAGATDAGDAAASDAGAGDAGSADLGATDAGDVDAGNVGDPCGARLGDTCTGQTYCRWALGSLCGAADAPGTCQVPPAQSSCPTTGTGVCANDGMMYANECLANAAGFSACSTGPCTFPPD